MGKLGSEYPIVSLQLLPASSEYPFEGLQTVANGYLRAKIKRFGGIGNTRDLQELQFYKLKNADCEFFS